MKFLDALKEQVLILDGAMGSMVQLLKLPDSAYGGEEFAMLSDLLVFSDEKDKATYTTSGKEEFVKADVSRQYEMLLYAQRSNGPTVFFHRESVLEYGGYMGPRNCADWPTVLNLSMKGMKIHYLPEGLTYYRRHETNVSDKTKPSWLKSNYEMKGVRNDYLLKKDLKFIHKTYCQQDLLKAKKKLGLCSNTERIQFIYLRFLYKALKLFLK